MTASARKQVHRDLKTRIADRAAVSDIEVYCTRKRINDALLYDIETAAPEAKEWVRQSCIYLCMRGLIRMRGHFAEITPKTLEVVND